MPRKNAKPQKSNELDGKEFFTAIDMIEKEKGIPKSYMLEKITQALTSAYKKDPDVAGVTCHLAYFERSTIDRLVQGNWFEDPSNSSIACRQTGPITLGDIRRGPEGEEIFSERQSLLLKTLSITRIYDEANRTLIYLAHAREVTEGSAKMSISTVPLWNAQGAEWVSRVFGLPRGSANFLRAVRE